jgi:hypothetical protein
MAKKLKTEFQALTKELDMIRAISEREAAANAVDPVPILAAGLEGDFKKSRPNVGTAALI